MKNLHFSTPGSRVEKFISPNTPQEQLEVAYALAEGFPMVRSTHPYGSVWCEVEDGAKPDFARFTYRRQTPAPTPAQKET